MSDLRTLTDAFDELARRGDAADARMPAALPRRSPALRRAVPIAVAAAVVAGLATTIAVLSPGDEPSTGTRPTTHERAWVPQSPDELVDRFRVVFGDRGTFEITSSSAPAAVNGTITAGGDTGGFDLQIYVDPTSREAWCAEPSNCTETTLPDGSHVAASTTGLDGGGRTHVVVRKTPDDVMTIMDVSNQHSPKGQSEVTADEPPLTLDEVVAIVTDDRW